MSSVSKTSVHSAAKSLSSVKSSGTININNSQSSRLSKKSSRPARLSERSSQEERGWNHKIWFWKKQRGSKRNTVEARATERSNVVSSIPDCSKTQPRRDVPSTKETLKKRDDFHSASSGVGDSTCGSTALSAQEDIDNTIASDAIQQESIRGKEDPIGSPGCFSEVSSTNTESLPEFVLADIAAYNSLHIDLLNNIRYLKDEVSYKRTSIQQTKKRLSIERLPPPYHSVPTLQDYAREIHVLNIEHNWKTTRREEDSFSLYRLIRKYDEIIKFLQSQQK